MHMLHMHISIDIIITLSFFITDFLLSSVLNGVSALDGGIVTLSAGFVNPLFYIFSENFFILSLRLNFSVFFRPTVLKMAELVLTSAKSRPILPSVRNF